MSFINENSLSFVAQYLLNYVIDGGSGLLITPNVDIMIKLIEDPKSDVSLDCFEAKFCLPDGQPIVWASKLLNKGLKSRLSGSGLFHQMWPLIIESEIPVSMGLASQELVDFFEKDYSLANCVVAPHIYDAFDSDFDFYVESIVKNAVQNKSKIIFLGIDHTKNLVTYHQIKNIWDEYSDDGFPLVIALGGSFEMYAGLRKRAPSWVQGIGMEWLFRFFQEPRRLFKRYFVYSWKFFKVIYFEILSSWSHSENSKEKRKRFWQLAEKKQ